MIKVVISVGFALLLSACATHTPAPEPKGELFPINNPALVQGKNNG